MAKHTHTRGKRRKGSNYNCCRCRKRSQTVCSILWDHPRFGPAPVEARRRRRRRHRELSNCTFISRLLWKRSLARTLVLHKRIYHPKRILSSALTLLIHTKRHPCFRLEANNSCYARSLRFAFRPLILCSRAQHRAPSVEWESLHPEKGENCQNENI